MQTRYWGLGPLGWAIIVTALFFLIFWGSPVRAQHVHGATACKPTENRLGYFGFKHCELHEQYQQAFKDWNCKCFSGQCRPTKFRQAPTSASNPTGFEIYLDGAWHPVPAEALRTDPATMTEELLEWDAHGCANKEKPPHIECAWLKLPS